MHRPGSIRNADRDATRSAPLDRIATPIAAMRSEPSEPLPHRTSGHDATTARLGLDFECEILALKRSARLLMPGLSRPIQHLARGSKSSPNRNRREAAMK